VPLDSHRDKSEEPVLEVEGLAKRYDGLLAVSDLSFVVRPAEILGLVGPNGAGKTTTMRCLAGILPPTAGKVRICGRDLATDPVEAKRHLAFIPDEPRLFDYLTVSEHLKFIARIYKVPDAEARASTLLAELELTDKTKSLPGELSRGMKQKLAIACGLLHDPAVILFDEPLTGLDPVGIRRMKDSIARRAGAGASIIVSSHLLHLVEELCHRILMIKSGTKVAHGTLAEIKAAAPELQADASLEDVFLHVTSQEPPAK
jgi:ABC-2 type transport system ATP-binding protein